MSDEYTQEGCIALVSVELETVRDLSAYIVGCRSPEEAKALVRQEYETEHIEIIASRLSAADVRGLKLRSREIRPWH